MFLDFKFHFHGVCVCTHICMCMCRGLKLVLGVFFNYPPDYFSSLLFFNESRISHWTGSFLLWTSLGVQLSLGSLVFDSHIPRVQAATIYICWAFYVGSGMQTPVLMLWRQGKHFVIWDIFSVPKVLLMCNHIHHPLSITLTKHPRKLLK